MELLQNWIRSLTAASAAAAVAKQLTPAGPVKKVTELACAVMLMGLLLAPAAGPQMDTLALSLSEYRRTAATLTEDMEDRKKQLLRSYIEQQCAAYIVDEAQRIEIDGINVTVKTRWRDECWVPCEVIISGEAAEWKKEKIRAWLESELGIGPERQRWDG